MDQAHEQIAHLGTVFGLIKPRVFSMENGSFEGRLAASQPAIRER
jgi:hypothetical protein